MHLALYNPDLKEKDSVLLQRYEADLKEGDNSWSVPSSNDREQFYKQSMSAKSSALPESSFLKTLNSQRNPDSFAAVGSVARKASTQEMKGLVPLDGRQTRLLATNAPQVERVVDLRDALKASTQERNGLVPLDGRQRQLLVDHSEWLRTNNSLIFSHLTIPPLIIL